MDEDTPSPIHNKKFYLNDEMTTFLVENQLFRVHRHFLVRDSECFSTMFQLPFNESTIEEGKSDDSPIVLPDVTAYEFEALLGYYYDQRILKSKKPNSDRRLRKWTAILSISTRLAFHQLRERAIETLSSITSFDPFDQLALANRYDIQEWRKSAYLKLSERPQPLSVSEAERLGLTPAILLAQAREEILRLPTLPSSLRKDRISNIVDSIFFPPQSSATEGEQVEEQAQNSSS